LQEHVTLCNDLWVAYTAALGLGYCLPLRFSSHNIPKRLELLQAELQNSQLSNWGYALAAHSQSQGADHHPHAPSLIWQHITIIIIIYISAVTHV